MSEAPAAARLRTPMEPRRAAEPARESAALSPCLRCGTAIPVRRMGCRGGRCPHCGHPYPHGDCSD